MKYAAFTLVLAGSLGACSGMKITTDYNPEVAPNFSAYQTYAWLPQPIRKDPRVYNAITENRVRRAVDNSLSAGGYRKLESGTPDFLVAWQAAIEGKVDVTMVNGYYGYGYRRWGAWGAEPMVREYDEGTLILDVIDAESRELVWRGVAQAKISQNSSPDQRGRKINEAVSKILANFPPER